MIPEDAVTTYLRNHGWPTAEASLAGIRGTGRILWLVLGDRTAEHAGDSLVDDWLAEAHGRTTRVRADLGVLVTPRRDYGPARAASWWAHLDVQALARITRSSLPLPATVAPSPVRMHLSAASMLLRAGGYGEPLTPAAVTT